MKIHISYQPDEEESAETLFQAAKEILPLTRVKKSETKPPFTHLYLTSKTRANPH